MRCLVCALMLWGLVGCRNQSASLTNPFLTPDRVPPPATRPLTPGTAQPYYPSDSVQITPASPQPTYTNPTTVPPATGYGSPMPGTSTVPTTPPGGWNTYPQQSSTSGASGSMSADGNVLPASAEMPIDVVAGTTDSIPAASNSVVRVPTDENQLRFAQAGPLTESPWTEPTGAPAMSQPIQQTQVQTPQAAWPSSTAANLTPPVAMQNGYGLTGQSSQVATTPQMPIQTILPTSYQSQGQPQRLQIREVTAAELLQPPSLVSTSSSASSRDGFRPQGSELPDTERSAFTRPSISRTASLGGDASSTVRYGFGPRYEWLRGRLEYIHATGQWRLRYIPIQGDVATQAGTDQFGGSALIDNPHLLGNLRPGDYVVVHGQLQVDQTDPRSFAPVYTVSTVHRQQAGSEM